MLAPERSVRVRVNMTAGLRTVRLIERLPTPGAAPRPAGGAADGPYELRRTEEEALFDFGELKTRMKAYKMGAWTGFGIMFLLPMLSVRTLGNDFDSPLVLSFFIGGALLMLLATTTMTLDVLVHTSGRAPSAKMTVGQFLGLLGAALGAMVAAIVLLEAVRP